jgi:hypothetical protein
MLLVKSEYCSLNRIFEEWLNKRIRCGRGHAAHVARVPQDLDVALVAPRLAPRVLDQPVLLAFLFAIANNQDSVIKIGRIAGLIRVNA